MKILANTKGEVRGGTTGHWERGFVGGDVTTESWKGAKVRSGLWGLKNPCLSEQKSTAVLYIRKDGQREEDWPG